MKSIIVGAAVLGGGLLGGGVLGATPAHATGPGKVEFSYSAPELAADGGSVTWRWTLTNVGDEDVDRVVLSHRITPKLRVASVSKPCASATIGTVRCDLGALKPAAKLKGTLRAVLPQGHSGTVQIHGKVTWAQGGGAPLTPMDEPAQPAPPAPRAVT